MKKINILNFKLTKKEKKVLTGIAIGIGALALIGAGGKIASKFKK